MIYLLYYNKINWLVIIYRYHFISNVQAPFVIILEGIYSHDIYRGYLIIYYLLFVILECSFHPQPYTFSLTDTKVNYVPQVKF